MPDVELEDLPTTVVVNDETVLVIEDSRDVPLDVLEVGAQGPMGPVGATGSVGPRGPVGPAGPPGGGSGGPVGLSVLDARTAVDLAPGASVDLDSTFVAGTKAGYLLAITYSSSVACRWDVKTVVAGVEVRRFVRMTSGLIGGMPEGYWATMGHDYVRVLDVAGTEHFRITVTNLDADWAADVYAEFYWDEVDQ